MKPRRISTEAEYERLERRLIEFADELGREDPTLFPPDLDPDWREAFRAGYEGQLAELERALRIWRAAQDVDGAEDDLHRSRQLHGRSRGAG